VAKNAEVSGIYVGSAEAFASMVRAIEQSGVRPVIDRVFRFGDVPAAYAHLSGAGHFGKVVIDFERD
jgi:NADPH:quinone reductase-like Zn-dependent oxidoreductase